MLVVLNIYGTAHGITAQRPGGGWKMPESCEAMSYYDFHHYGSVLHVDKTGKKTILHKRNEKKPQMN